MKKVIKFLPIAAIVLGSGLALATSSKINPHNVYLDPGTNQWKDLTPYLPNQYECPGDGWCTAYRDTTGAISDESPGVFSPLI